MDDTRRDSVNKAKRSKTDQVSHAISTYLQKRNYPECSPAEINEEQMSLAITVDSEVSRSNSISYSCFNSDPIIVDHNFSKLLAWLKQLHEKTKDHQDIDFIIAPLFCHLYIEILQRGHSDKASNFFKFHFATFDKTKCDDTIKKLINAIATNSIDCNSLKKTFRSNKYIIELSSESALILKKFLSDNSHVVLFQVLQTWFEIVEDVTDTSDTETESIREKMNGFSIGSSNKTALCQIFDVIKSVKNDPPPMYTVNLSNAKDDITCGLINRELGIAVYSYNSCIFIRSLRQLDYQYQISEHTDRIYDFAVIKQYNYLISASNDTTVKLFDLNTYQLVNKYKGHDFPVYTVESSPNGFYIVSGCYGHSTRLWAIDRNETLRLYAAHTQEVTAVNFHSNSLYFATGSADKTIRMWSIQEAFPVRLFLGSKGTIYAIAFSPNGKYLATAGDDKRIRIWDLTAGKQLAEIKVGSEPIMKLAWSSNGDTICSGSIDGSIKEWDFNGVIKDLENNQHTFVSCILTNAKLLSLEYAFDTFACLTAQTGISSHIKI